MEAEYTKELMRKEGIAAEQRRQMAVQDGKIKVTAIPVEEDEDEDEGCK